MSTTIGDYLLSRLAEMGVRHMFGVPGDFSLLFLERATQAGAPEFVGCCNELNASCAADGYARLNGIGALATTYGVGELAALSGVAGAYAERVPVVCITGAPPLNAMKSGALIHHSMADGDFDNMMVCYREFTVAQVRLEPKTACLEIDRVLRACWLEKRPVYIQLPSDLIAWEVPDIEMPLELDPPAESFAHLAQAISKITARLDQAERPAILLDADADRFGLTELILGLAEMNDIPIASLAPARGVVPDTHPLVLGAYRGAASTPAVREAVESSDCLICIGARLTDMSTGLFTQKLEAAFIIDVQPTMVTIGEVAYDRVGSSTLLTGLLRAKPRHRPSSRHLRSVTMPSPAQAQGPLTQSAFWSFVQGILEPGDVVLADSGTSLFAAAALNLPRDVTFIAQPIWASIGYTLPALLGACLAAPHRRHLLFIGDGGFQMTAQELSTILRLDLKPIIFLINNDGYTIERLITGPNAAYNDIQPWRYSEMPAVFAPTKPVLTRTADTEAELSDAFAAVGRNSMSFIEVRLPRLDAPGDLAKFARRAAEFDYPQIIDAPPSAA
jgi:indolepyruvate decarboxylase